MQDEDFVEFAATATPALLRLGWLLTGDRQQAQDLAQSALVRTYTSWHRIRNDDALAYARKVTVNLHTDWLRRRPWLERSRADVPERQARADDHGTVETRMALVTALQSLGRRERAIVVLRYYVDLSEAETAHILDISPGTVKSVCSRALRKLRVSPALAATAPAGVLGATS